MGVGGDPERKHVDTAVAGGTSDVLVPGDGGAVARRVIAKVIDSTS
jgi:hypothetical protein